MNFFVPHKYAAISIFFSVIFFSISANEPKKEVKKMPVQFQAGDTQFGITVKYRPDTLFGKNINLGNSLNNEDRILYARHSFDILFDYIYGRESHGYDVVKFRWDLRNKATWGVASNIPTINNSLRDIGGVTFGEHNHGIPRHLMWIRQLWGEISIADMLSIDTKYMHTFTLGAFPFVLGRGIALGDAYAVDPDLLGFDSETAVDQFAYGFKFTGELIQNKLTYDVYAAILDNKDTSFKDATARIYSQRFDFRTEPQRGPENIRFVNAVRFMWKPWNSKGKRITLEPYALFSNIPEQFIEFPADAESKLGTVGIAGEFEWNNFEFGFDTAKNLGRQVVYGWDRNTVSGELRKGAYYAVNSNVTAIADNPATGDLAGKKAVVSKENTFIINTAPQGEQFNNQQIGLSNLRNDANRFSNPYINRFSGSMFVADGTYWIRCNKELGVSLAVGYASGDENPNFALSKFEEFSPENNFEGFISLQEVYSGTRVESTYFLNGSGKLPRVVSQPDSGLIFTEIDSVSKFTNLILAGISAEYAPKQSNHKPKVKPNIIAFWSDVPTRIPLLNGEPPRPEIFTRRFFGTEVNTLAEALLLPDLKIFGKVAVFFPGNFYKDYAGYPINDSQRRYLEDKIAIANAVANNTNNPQIILVREPLLGADRSFAVNVGLEYRF